MDALQNEMLSEVGDRWCAIFEVADSVLDLGGALLLDSECDLITTLVPDMRSLDIRSRTASPAGAGSIYFAA